MDRLKLIFIAFLLVPFQGMAQKEITVLNNTRPIGKNLISGEPIIANEYIFPERINDFQVDTVNDAILIQLRGLRKKKWLANKGEVIRYDTEKEKVLWVDKIVYQSERIEQFGGITIRSTGNNSYCLDNETGEKLWKVKNSIIFANPVEKIGIGYRIQPSSTKTDNILEGIDLRDGRVIWQREIYRGYGWNDAFYLNDSTVLIAAAGLHTVNIFDGTGWDYNTTTGKKDYTASAVGTGLGIVAGLLTGMYSVSTGYNLLRDVVSNVLVDGESIYFASKTFIVRLNRKGETQWMKELPEDLTSKSHLIMLDSNVVMVNRGFAFMGYRQLDFGVPFFAAFNLDSGDQKYFIPVANDNEGIIKGIDLLNQQRDLIIAFNNHMVKYNLENGESMLAKAIDKSEYGEIEYFIGSNVFLSRDSIFLPLTDLDSTGLYLYTEKGKILAINEHLEISEEIELEDLYFNYLNRDNVRFIAHKDSTFVIDKMGKKTASFLASRKSTFLNDKLYSTQERIIREIDLRGIIEE